MNTVVSPTPNTDEDQTQPPAEVLHAAGKLRVHFDGIQQGPLHRGPQFQFTDRKPDSTTHRSTFYVPVQAPDALRAFLEAWVALKEKFAAEEARAQAIEDARLQADTLWEARFADDEYDRNR